MKHVQFLHPEEAQQADSAKWNMHPPGTIGAWVAEMDVALASPIREALLDAVDRSVTGYPVASLHGTADVIAAWCGDRLGQAVDPALVRFAPNVIGAIKQALGVLTQPGDRLILTTPVYFPFFLVAEEMGLEQVRVSMIPGEQRSRLDLDALEAAAAKGGVLLLCHPHNPTGSVTTRAELEAVAEIVRTYGNAVISDEIHAALTMPGAEFIAFSEVAPDLADRTITVSAATKTFNFPGLKLGWLIPGSEELAERIDAIPFLKRMGYSSFGAPATRAALTEGGPWLDELLIALDARRHQVRDLVREYIPKASYVMPEATYLAWVDMSAYNLGPDPAAMLLEHGVALSSGPVFGTEGTGFVRINFGCHEDTLEEVFRRMAAGIAARA